MRVFGFIIRTHPSTAPYDRLDYLLHACKLFHSIKRINLLAKQKGISALILLLSRMAG
jgi:hypothetical protein